MLRKLYNGSRLTWNDHNEHVSAIEANRAVVGQGVSRFTTGVHQSRRSVSMGGAGMDYSDFVFGFSVSGAVVTVNHGEVLHGMDDIVPCTGADITITADYQYVYFEYTLPSGPCSLAGPSTTKPVPDGSIFRVWLTRWRFIAGVASLDDGGINHIGGFFMPGTYAS